MGDPIKLEVPHVVIWQRDRESYQRQFYVKAGWHERAEAANFIYTLS